MAPKSAEKKAKAGSPKQKSPTKKQKTEEEEVAVEEGEQQREQPEAGAGEGAAEEEGLEAAQPSGEAGPAAHTRAREGGPAPASASKQAAASVAANLLPQPGIADILLADHRDTVALLKKHQELAGSGDKLMLEKLTDAIAVTIRLHSQAEFDVLYPMVEKKLGGKGQQSAEHSRGEHAKIESDLLEALQKRKEGGEGLSDTIKEITDLFLAHLKEEEEEILPQLLAKCSDEEQVDLANAFMEAKAKATLEPQPASA